MAKMAHFWHSILGVQKGGSGAQIHGGAVSETGILVPINCLLKGPGPGAKMGPKRAQKRTSRTPLFNKFYKFIYLFMYIYLWNTLNKYIIIYNNKLFIIINK